MWAIPGPEGRLVQGREYASLAEAQADPALTETACPYCGETVTLGQWARKDPDAAGLWPVQPGGRAVRRVPAQPDGQRACA